MTDQAWRWTLIAGLYAAVNLVLLFFTVPGAAIAQGADASSWIEPAWALLEYGAFVDYRDPASPETFRTPLYPLFLGIFLWLGDGAVIFPVLAQIVLLFLTGWILRGITETWLPGYGDLALALVIFNPNALGSAHLIQSETFYTLWVTAALASFLAFAKGPTWVRAAAAGGLLGLACLSRPEPQFIVPLLPVIFPLLASLAGHRRMWPRHLLMGLTASLVAAALLVPWMLHNERAGEGFRLSSWRVQNHYIWENIVHLEMYSHGLSPAAAAAKVAPLRARASSGAEWEALSRREQGQRLFDEGLRLLASYDASDIARAYLFSWGQLFLAGGAGNLHNLLGLEVESTMALIVHGGSEGYVAAWLESLRGGSAAALAITAAALGFVLVMRVLGLIGLAAMAARRHWLLFVTLSFAIAYYAFLYMFHANSRFRVQLDPMLILLALYGVDWCRGRISGTLKRG